MTRSLQTRPPAWARARGPGPQLGGGRDKTSGYFLTWSRQCVQCPPLPPHPATNWVKSVRSWKNVGSGLGTMEIYDTDNGFEFDFDRGLLEVETVPGAWEQLALPCLPPQTL